MSTVTLNDRTVTACVITLPAWGIWFADVEIDEPETLTGAVELKAAGLELSGTVMTGGPWQGRARYRIAGGAGGWGTELPSRSYANDAGVKLATVIGDAATACGETLDATTVSGTVGAQWIREAGPASRALALLAPQSWYVAEDGTTKLGARESVTWQNEHTTERTDEALAKIELAADDLAGLVPGAIVDGMMAVDVVHTLNGSSLRSVVYGDRGASDRILSAFERLVKTIMSRERYRGIWSYRVVAQSGERLDLQVERSSSRMPDLQRVKVRPGIPGARADHTLGSMVLVGFIDGDPSRPVVVAGDDADSPGFIPSELDLCEADGRVLREGDTMTLTGVMPGGSATGVTALVTVGLGTPPVASKVFA